MECPFCHHDIAATWQPFSATTDELGNRIGSTQTQIGTNVRRETGALVGVAVWVQWLKCQNTECQEIVVLITRSESGRSESWIGLPKKPDSPKVHQLITDPFRKDYLEAWIILYDSPRMSAVLSRRVLADLLEKYAGLNQFSLAKRIDAFIADTKHPLWIRQNLHYLREIGDFGAHTQQDKTVPPNATQQPPPDPTIINVDKSEAEWTLRIIADLFEYFIVAPQKDEEMRKAIAKKLADANRNAITPLTN